MSLVAIFLLILGGFVTVAVLINGFIEAGEDAEWQEYLDKLEKQGAEFDRKYKSR